MEASQTDAGYDSGSRAHAASAHDLPPGGREGQQHAYWLADQRQTGDSRPAQYRGEPPYLPPSLGPPDHHPGPRHEAPYALAARQWEGSPHEMVRRPGSHSVIQRQQRPLSPQAQPDSPYHLPPHGVQHPQQQPLPPQYGHSRIPQQGYPAQHLRPQRFESPHTQPPAYPSYSYPNQVDSHYSEAGQRSMPTAGPSRFARPSSPPRGAGEDASHRSMVKDDLSQRMRLSFGYQPNSDAAIATAAAEQPAHWKPLGVADQRSSIGQPAHAQATASRAFGVGSTHAPETEPRDGFAVDARSSPYQAGNEERTTHDRKRSRIDASQAEDSADSVAARRGRLTAASTPTGRRPAESVHASSAKRDSSTAAQRTADFTTGRIDSSEEEGSDHLAGATQHDGPDSSAQPCGETAAAGGKTKRRKRAILSCTECKQRKIKCDRNVPNCGSCVRRGVAHLCRWGDERDEIASGQTSNITPSNAALMARIAQLESQVRSLQSNGQRPNSLTAASAMAFSEAGDEGRPGQVGASGGSQTTASVVDGPRGRSHPALVGAAGAHQRSATFEGERVAQQRGSRAGKRDKGDRSDASDSLGSEDEDAVGVLEALARGTRLRRVRETAHDLHAKRREEGNSVESPPPAIIGQIKAEAKPSTLDTQTDSHQDGQVAEPNEDHPERVDNASANLHPRGSVAAAKAAESLLDTLKPFPSVDLHVGDPDRPSHNDLLVLLRLLPPRDAVVLLCRIYINESEPLVHSLHAPTLWTQLNDFWKDVDALENALQDQDATSDRFEGNMPDLQFAALVFALVEGACEYLVPCEIISHGLCAKRDEICNRLTLLVRASSALLSIANFSSSPRIPGFQTVIALRHYSFKREFRQEYIVLYTMAIKLAELVGMHRLGNAIEDQRRWDKEGQSRLANTSDDGSASRSGRSQHVGSSQQHQKKSGARQEPRRSADSESESEVELLDPIRLDLNSAFLPRGRQKRRWEARAAARFHDHCHLQRELPRKVWYSLVTLDWFCAAFFDRCYHCADEQFTTQTPQNIDDEDLVGLESSPNANGEGSKRDSKSTGTLLTDRIQSWNEPSYNSFVPIHVEIARTVRSIADAQNRGEDSYEVVMRIDSRFRQILENLPPFFRLDGATEHDSKIIQLHRERPYLSLQRVIIYEYVHHRLLMLHRLYMGKGYGRSRYAYSTRTCIESARVVIALLRCLEQVQSLGGTRGGRYWITAFHIYHALLALQMDLVSLSSQPFHDEVAFKAKDVMCGLQLMLARTDPEGRNPILMRSVDVIKSLRKDEKQRRARHDAERERKEGGRNADSADANVDRARQAILSAEDKSQQTHRTQTHASRDTGKAAQQLAKSVLETWPNLREISRNNTACAPLLRRTSSVETRGALSGESRRSSAIGRGDGSNASRPTSSAGAKIDDTAGRPLATVTENAPGAESDAFTNSTGNHDGEAVGHPLSEPPAVQPQAQEFVFEGNSDLDSFLDLLTTYQISSETIGAPNLFDVAALNGQSYGTSMELAPFPIYDPLYGVPTSFGPRTGMLEADGTLSGPFNGPMLTAGVDMGGISAVGMPTFPASAPPNSLGAAMLSADVGPPPLSLSQLDAGSGTMVNANPPAGVWDEAASSSHGGAPSAIYNQPRPPPLNVNNLLSGNKS